MDRDKLARELIRDEGMVLHAYQDSEGYWTIGVGRLIDKRLGGGISEEEAEYLLDHDIDDALRHARRYDWFDDLTDARQRCIVNMIFNMGPSRFAGFRRMIAAIERGDYEEAAREMEDSRWCRQVGPRCERLKEMMRHG